MRVVGMFAALTLAAVAVPASATVAPITPEGQKAMAAQQVLHDRTVRAFGIGIIERLRDPQKAYASVLFARENDRSAPRLLVRDELGWVEQGPGRRERRLPEAIGDEIDRLFADARLWSENGFTSAPACRGGAILFDLHYAGQSQFGRDPCRANGIGARIAAIALTRRIPATQVISTVPVGVDQDHTLARIVHRALENQNVAFGRRMLPGFVEIYSRDARIDFPTTSLVGQRSIVAWARSLQDWTSFGRPGDLSLYQSTVQPQQGPYVLSTHEVRWTSPDGRPLRRTYSELWRDEGGVWRIVHQRVSNDKPVTNERR